MNVRTGRETANDATWGVRLPDGRAVGVTVRLDDIHWAAVGYTPVEGHGFKNNCRLDYREDEASNSSSDLHGRVGVAAPTASRGVFRHKGAP